MKSLLQILFTILLLPALVFADQPTQVDFLISGFTDSSGQPLAGGKVYTYSAGTTSDKTTWQDASKSTPHANPIILDAQGKKLVFADGNYKFRIDDANDTTLYTLDGLKFGLYNDGSSTYGGVTTGSSNAYVLTLTPPLLALTNGAEVTFEANHTNTGAATLNVNSLGAIDLNRSNDTAMGANEIISGNTYTAVYESSTNAWLLRNVTNGWTSYTPTLTGEASMTYTSTSITAAKYRREGKTVFFYVSFTGTVGGTPDARIRFTLPFAASDSNITAAGNVTDAGAVATASFTVQSSSALQCRRYNSANFTAGTVACVAFGFYEAAT